MRSLCWFAIACMGCGSADSSDTQTEQDGGEETATLDDGGGLFDGAIDDGSVDDASLEDAVGDETFVDAAPDEGMEVGIDAAPTYPFPTPIKYIVVIVKENHTFDSMFTNFPGTDAPPATVKLKSGTTVTRKAAAFANLAADMSHTHASGTLDYNDGKMNGWSDTDGAAPLGQPFSYFPESQIKSYWAYARNFVLFDRFFATHMGPTSPGHFATHTATSVHFENPDGDGDCADPTAAGTVGVFDPTTGLVKDMFPCFDVPAVESLLPPSLEWRAYGSQLDRVKSIGGNPTVRAAHYRSFPSLFGDLEKDDIKNLTYLNITSAQYNGAQASEHPPAHPCHGEQYTVEIINRLMNSKHWPEMAIIVTYDDFGGWYDHVKPKVELCDNGRFFHTGFRLPAMIISPYAKTGVVDHTHTEHASIPRLIEDLFGLPRLKANPTAPWNKYIPRDGTAGSMMSAFDFAQVPRPSFIRPVRTDCPVPAP